METKKQPSRSARVGAPLAERTPQVAPESDSPESNSPGANFTAAHSSDANLSGNRSIEILLKKLEEAKAKNPRLSMRSFAMRVGMSSGSLSEVLSGKRILTHAVKQRVAPKLLLSPQETIEFFGTDFPLASSLTVDSRVTLSQDQFHLISDWWYFGLLNLVKTRGFKNHFGWMARRMGLSTQVVRDAWDRLFRLGYLELVGSKVVRKQPNIKTTDNMIDLSVRKSHLEDLKLIENSLHEIPIDLRDNTSCSFVVDKKDLAKAKEMIRIFQKQFLTEIGKDTGDEVYKLSIALYPLTQVTGEQ